jgi:uncharacterized protein YrrD
MAKGTDVIGKAIIVHTTGEQKESIYDLVVDHARNSVLGFLVDKEGWFGNPRMLPIEGVQAIGPDAVIVPSADSFHVIEQDDELYRFDGGNRVLKGVKIMTEHGKDLGTITDLQFNDTTGAIEGYEVSGGLFADTYSGRSFVPVSQALVVGKDVAFVPDETEQLMEQQVGGIKAATQAAGQKIQDASQAAGEKYDSVKDSASQKLGDMKEKAPGAMQNTSSHLHSGSEDLKQQVTDFWQDVKKTVTDYKDQTAQHMEEGKIKNALGRPVNRPIFDKSDQVILNTGDLITNHVVERARENGVLDILLSSVYGKEPEFSNEELKAKKA